MSSGQDSKPQRARWGRGRAALFQQLDEIRADLANGHSVVAIYEARRTQLGGLTYQGFYKSIRKYVGRARDEGPKQKGKAVPGVGRGGVAQASPPPASRTSPPLPQSPGPSGAGPRPASGSATAGPGVGFQRVTWNPSSGADDPAVRDFLGDTDDTQEH